MLENSIIMSFCVFRNKFIIVDDAGMCMKRGLLYYTSTNEALATFHIEKR